jgi:hypothetical protein
MDNENSITLIYTEGKKHSAKYVVDGTQQDQWPSYIYIRPSWIGSPKSYPQKLKMTLAAV